MVPPVPLTTARRRRLVEELSEQGLVLDGTLRKKRAIVVRIMRGILLALRIADGTIGSSVGAMYSALLQVDNYFQNDLHTLLSEVYEDPDACERVVAGFKRILTARWEYFHSAAHTASFALQPWNLKRELSGEQKRELFVTFKQIATGEHTFADLNFRDVFTWC